MCRTMDTLKRVAQNPIALLHYLANSEWMIRAGIIMNPNIMDRAVAIYTNHGDDWVELSIVLDSSTIRARINSTESKLGITLMRLQAGTSSAEEHFVVECPDSD